MSHSHNGRQAGAAMLVAAVLMVSLAAGPAQAEAGWSLAIHGGAGVVRRDSLTPEQEALYREGLQAALAAGQAVLETDGSALDAVEAAVRVLEDNPLFNAGKGAVFTAEGRNELDASIMDGATLKAGAVAGVTRTRNPVSLARAVMEKTRHVLLAYEGADAFSAAQGLEQVEPDYFFTPRRWEQLQKWKTDKAAGEVAGIDESHRYGTVGAVARDSRGNLAAATSTGGLTGKMWGRVGDTPLIGAGTYALNGVCAVSGTGTGEYFIRVSAARQVCDRVQWNGQDIGSATRDTIRAITDLGGNGGLIAIGAEGAPVFGLNAVGMYRGQVSQGQPPATAIFTDEGLQ